MIRESCYVFILYCSLMSVFLDVGSWLLVLDC